MDRLTERGFDFTTDFVASNLQSWPIAQALTRLQEFEDTGLSPAEVAELVHEGIPAALDKLAEYESTGLQPEEVRKLADALAEGRVVVLPCKPMGDFYAIRYTEHARMVCTHTAFGFQFDAEGKCTYVYTESNNPHRGKKVAVEHVYITREEAESALARREEA